MQHRLIAKVPFLVIDMRYDVIIGRKWLKLFDVALDVRRRRLLFPWEWEPQRIENHLAIDEAGKLITHPSTEEDVIKRERLITKEDQRRVNGRKSSKLR